MAVNMIQITLNEDEKIAFFGDLHADNMTPGSRIDKFLDTVVLKLEDIRKKCIRNNVKVGIFLGDVFSRIQVTNECINTVMNALWKFRDSGIDLFSIVGNHDIPRNQMEALIKSPLQTLFSSRVMKHIDINNRLVINRKTLITPADYLNEIPEVVEKAPFNILVAHVFFDDEFAGGKANLSKEDVKRLGYNCAVLGHDHPYYPIVNCEGTDIVRGGSITRGTSHKYNFDRVVGFYILKKPWEYSVNNFSFVEIDVKPMKDVISSSVQNDKFGNLADLGSLMNDLVLKLSSSEAGKGSSIIDDVRNDRKLSDEVKDLLLNYFEEAGIIC